MKLEVEVLEVGLRNGKHIVQVLVGGDEVYVDVGTPAAAREWASKLFQKVTLSSEASK